MVNKYALEKAIYYLVERRDPHLKSSDLPGSLLRECVTLSAIDIMIKNTKQTTNPLINRPLSGNYNYEYQKVAPVYKPRHLPYSYNKRHSMYICRHYS